MRNTNRREQYRSPNQSWSQPSARRNRGNQRFGNEASTGRNYSSDEYEQGDRDYDYDRENSWQERHQRNRGYGNEGREYVGGQFGGEGREYRGQERRNYPNSGSSYGWGESAGSERGYGNDPESFASSNERRNFGNAGREFYGDTYGTTSYGGGRGTLGMGEGYGGSRGQGSNFGRSWNRNEEDFSSMSGNRGQHGNRSSLWESDMSRESHRGKGPKGYQRSDERIREDINEQLSDDHQIDASEIEVKVEKGEVTLTGSVNDRISKHLAEEIVESVSGVKNVENRIRITEENTKTTGATPSGTSTKSNDRSKMRESVA